jgi:hypothetical protein
MKTQSTTTQPMKTPFTQAWSLAFRNPVTSAS